MSLTEDIVDEATEASPRGSSRAAADGVVTCLADQLRLLGYTVTPPSAAPTAAASPPARAGDSCVDLVTPLE